MRRGPGATFAALAVAIDERAHGAPRQPHERQYECERRQHRHGDDDRGRHAERADPTKIDPRMVRSAPMHRAKIIKPISPSKIARIRIGRLSAGQDHCSGNGDCHQSGPVIASIDATHFTHQKPRRPGATRRAGAP